MGCSRYLGAKLKRAPIRKPPRIRSGDVVGVIAPAGAVDGERLSAGVAVLEGWGLRVQVGSAVLKRHAYLAGSDEERLADLVQMIEDPRVRAIFCARGGYGSQRLLPRLDFARLARQPKPIIGYSDATALLGAAVEAGGLGGARPPGWGHQGPRPLPRPPPHPPNPAPPPPVAWGGGGPHPAPPRQGHPAAR